VVNFAWQLKHYVLRYINRLQLSFQDAIPYFIFFSEHFTYRDSLICGTSATSYLGVLREGDVPYGKAARNTNTIQRDVEDAIPYSLLRKDAIPYSLLRKDAIPYRKNQLSMIKV